MSRSRSPENVWLEILLRRLHNGRLTLTISVVGDYSVSDPPPILGAIAEILKDCVPCDDGKKQLKERFPAHAESVSDLWREFSGRCISKAVAPPEYRTCGWVVTVVLA